MYEVLRAYAITFGWAIVGAVSVGLGLIIAIKLFERSTGNVDEWGEIRKGNVAMAIVLASVIVSIGIVLSTIVQP